MPQLADKLFNDYRAPIRCSEEKKPEYDEIGERIVEQLKQRTGRRSR